MKTSTAISTAEIKNTFTLTTIEEKIVSFLTSMREKISTLFKMLYWTKLQKPVKEVTRDSAKTLATKDCLIETLIIFLEMKL